VKRQDTTPGRARWFIATAIAVSTLAAGVIFGSIQVAHNTAETKRAREATELQLLTQLNGVVTESVRRVNSQGSLNLAGLPARQRANFEEAISNFDYVAWLFKHGFVAVPAARPYWYNSMRCAYEVATALMAPKRIQTDFPNLLTHVRDGPACR
jgi:hypothetical protein